MSKTIVKSAVILGATLFLVACSGGSKGKFVEACADSLARKVGSAEEAKTVCNCTHKRLSDELNGKQLSMAADIMSLKGQRDVQEYIGKNKGADLVSERIEGGIKSCVGGF